MSKEIAVSETLARHVVHLPESVFFQNPYNADFVLGKGTFLMFPLPAIGLLVAYLIGIIPTFLLSVVVLPFLPTINPSFRFIFSMLGLFLFSAALSIGMLVGNFIGHAVFGFIVARRFQRNGQLLSGEIMRVDILPATFSQKHPIVEIKYQFTQPKGSLVRKKMQETHLNFDIYRPLPHPFTPVYILYFNNKEHYLL